MSIMDAMIPEYEGESAITKKVLMGLPGDQFDFRPHEKSMTLGNLAGHLAENGAWAKPILSMDELDVVNMGYIPFVATNVDELVERFNTDTSGALEAMQGVTDEELMRPWRMLKGGELVFEMPKIAVLRMFVFSHAVHHRGQLSVYLRLMGERVPSIYGPTADEPV